MINVEILKKDVHITSIAVSGHASYAPYGEDIVCSGVSALCQACAESLTELTAGKFDIHLGSGDFYITVTDYGIKDDVIKINTLLDGLAIGLKSIKESYPDYVKVKERRVRR
jgi:hypothetical protein